MSPGIHFFSELPERSGYWNEDHSENDRPFRVLSGESCKSGIHSNVLHRQSVSKRTSGDFGKVPVPLCCNASFSVFLQIRNDILHIRNATAFRRINGRDRHMQKLRDFPDRLVL